MSKRDSEKPVALDAYEALAGVYAANVDTKAHNAYYDRPATLSLLPEVAGRRALDAGCGPGVYSEWLVNHGAEVLAFDASKKMVSFARRRLGKRARVVRADFGRPLRFLEDASFDIIVSGLALDYVKDWNAVFREFHRVLRAPGHLVFSVEHPFENFIRYAPQNYFETTLVHYVWRGFGRGNYVRVPAYRRSMSAIVNPLLETGFRLERLLEPTPTVEFREQEPEEYERLLREPGFLSVRAAKISN